MSAKPATAVALLLAGLALFGCGGREARPVAKTTSFDDKLSCGHIASQLKANRARIADLGVEAKLQSDQNVAKVIFTGPWFMNLNDSEQEEIEALVERNGVLEGLARKKQCPPSENPAAAAQTPTSESAEETTEQTAE